MKQAIVCICMAAALSGCVHRPEARNRAAVHARMSELHRSYLNRGITNIDNWSAADRAEFDALLKEYTR